MADRHSELIGIDQFFLERVFPQTTPGPIAAAAIGQDEQVRRLGIALAPFRAPPGDDRFHGELGGVMGGADHDRTPIGLGIIEATRNGDPLGLRGKIMVVHPSGFLAPDPARVLEAPHQFLLLGVHANDGKRVAYKLLALPFEIPELTISLWALWPRETLAVGA